MKKDKYGNKYIASLVREYTDEWVRDPCIKMSKDSFMARSAERWAVEESIKAILSYDGTAFEALVELSRKLVNGYGDWMFSVAKDVVDDIYYYICDVDKQEGEDL